MCIDSIASFERLRKSFAPCTVGSSVVENAIFAQSTAQTEAAERQRRHTAMILARIMFLWYEARFGGAK